MNNPSVYDIAHKSNEAGKALSVFDEGTMQANRQAEARRQEAAPQRHLEAIARGLPDAMFADRPEIVSLTKELAVRKERVQRLARGGALPGTVGDAISALQQQLTAAAEALRLAAIDDALAGDLEFPRALATRLPMELLELKLQAARLAYADLNRSPMSKTYFSEHLRRAEVGLGDALFRLKREHVQAHPELLSVSFSGT